MSPGKRVLLFATLLVLLGTGVAMALSGGSGDGTGPQALLGGTSQTLAAAGAQATPLAGLLDPAKQEPVLDMFTSKDPFVPLTSPAATVSPTPSPTATSAVQNPESASIKIDATTMTVHAGDEVPSANPVFEIASLKPSGVTFELLDDMQFEDGSSSVLVGEGQVVNVTNVDTGITYRLEVIDLKYAGEGNTTPATEHSIALLSVNTQNGQSTATFKVDGTTYADKGVGAVFATDWGQIKVLAISASMQTATILHGDDTLVLHVGQTIEK